MARANQRHRWQTDGLGLPAVAGVAGHCVVTEISLVGSVQGLHHPHHPARSLLLRFVITVPNPVGESRLRVFALLDVTETALHAERGSNKIHQGEKLWLGQPFEHLNVLACFVDELVGWRSLSGRKDA